MPRTFFKRPSFGSLTPEKKRYQSPPRVSSQSSPLTNPPSSFIDLTSEPSNEPDIRPKSPRLNEEVEKTPKPIPSEQSSQSFLCTDEAPPSSLNASSQTTQRIIKGGKEVVISSDGEDTDSDSSLGEDPMALFMRKFKPTPKPAAPKAVPPPPKQISTTPKKYQNTIDSLVYDAVDDNETEENIAKLKARFAKAEQNGVQQGGVGLHEEMLTSVLGENNEEEGGGIRRLIDAVRRTEALDQDKTWRFLDQTQAKPIVVEFPEDLFSPESKLAGLRALDSRSQSESESESQSQRLPDKFIRWLFRAVPLEPQEELRQAYCRVITQFTRVNPILRPSDIDDLFKQLGASPQALDFSKWIEEDNKIHKESSLKVRGGLLSTFDLLRDVALLLDNDTTNHAIQTLLRMTLDNSLTSDDMIRSELQSCLSTLLESVPDDYIEEMERQVCTTVYNTVRDVQFQSRMLQNILPTAPWISMLRYRLAMAFLLRCSDPLTEPIQDVLNLDRLSTFLASDERVRVKSFNKKFDHAYSELTAISMLLDIVLNNSLYDLKDKQANTETEFNAAIDKIAAQIKRIFSSIEDSGAAHLKRMLAKQALEAVHYRVVYSVRTKPPPPKIPYEAMTRKDGDLGKWFKPQPGDNTPEVDGPSTPRKHGDIGKLLTSQTPNKVLGDRPNTDSPGTVIPIRNHGSP
ncbi:hypothetical protein N7456_007248 [Penicillium angulare]|uniref:Uncharacterized protein n=1 Tax=Penicillium angulare TaxID=116970 RepID=A0A9W9FJ53_9EURO|nr:hypothetical protein N7456_007248 [Penicillium angulare]